MKPIPFLLVAVPSLAAIAMMVSWQVDLSWIATAGLFYAGLVIAELAFLFGAIWGSASQATARSSLVAPIRN